MGWLRESEEAVARALCAALSMTWNDSDTLDFIRYTYRENGNSPMPEASRNVCYITLSVVSDMATSWASTEYQGGVATVQKTIPLSCLLSFYGSDSLELAEKAWTGLMLDTGADSPRGIMRRFGIVPVTRPERPVSMNEAVSGMWRLRSDLRLRLNLLHSDEYSFEPIEEPPDVTVTI